MTRAKKFGGRVDRVDPVTECFLFNLGNYVSDACSSGFESLHVSLRVFFCNFDLLENESSRRPRTIEARQQAVMRVAKALVEKVWMRN